MTHAISAALRTLGLRRLRRQQHHDQLAETLAGAVGAERTELMTLISRQDA